jgi:hypothetical protein
MGHTPSLSVVSSIHHHHHHLAGASLQPVRLAGGQYPMLMCSERKVLPTGCWWLICSEKKFCRLISQANGASIATPATDVRAFGYGPDEPCSNNRGGVGLGKEE